ncbi:MAG: hypothetical protein ACRC0L_05325, partial [Angustibacter sp.]
MPPLVPAPSRSAPVVDRRTILRGGLLGALGFVGGASVAMLTDSAPTAATAPGVDPRRGIAEIFARRQRAVQAADVGGWLADIAPSAVTFRQQEERSFRNIQAVPVRDWAYRVLGEPEFLPDGRWRASVQLAYRLEEGDRTPVLHERTYLGGVLAGRPLLTDDQPAALASVDSGLSTTVRWWAGPAVSAQRRGTALVIGSSSPPTLEEVAEYAQEAVGRVAQWWDAPWLGRAVVIAPASQPEFGALLDRNPTGLDQLAAVTASSAALEAGNTARVVINPRA